jgi:Leucine-rich repeat (LRR) protein
MNPNLNDLYLAINKLDHLDDDTFSNNAQLTSIDLSNNMLKSISINLFRNNPNLNQLRLSGNQLEKLDDDTFVNNEALFWLEINKNQLKSISKNMF